MIIIIALLLSAIVIIVIQLHEIKKLKNDILLLKKELEKKELTNRYYWEVCKRIKILKHDNPVIVERVEVI